VWEKKTFKDSSQSLINLEQKLERVHQEFIYQGFREDVGTKIEVTEKESDRLFGWQEENVK
jgi:hypothetical protein